MNLRALLWAPAALGVVLGGLSVANMYATGVGITIASAPQTIIDAYRSITDALVYFTVERWLGWKIPFWIKNALVLWVAFGASNLRAVFWLGGRNSLGSIFVAPVIGITGITNLTVLGIFRGVAVFALGPAATVLMFISTSRHLARAIRAKFYSFEEWTERYQSILKTEDTFLENSWAERYDEDRSDFGRIHSLFLNITILLLTIILNALVAAGFLWWNSAEIARLTS